VDGIYWGLVKQYVQNGVPVDDLGLDLWGFPVE